MVTVIVIDNINYYGELGHNQPSKSHGYVNIPTKVPCNWSFLGYQQPGEQGPLTHSHFELGNHQPLRTERVSKRGKCGLPTEMLDKRLKDRICGHQLHQNQSHQPLSTGEFC